MYDLFYEPPAPVAPPVVKKQARVFRLKKYWPKDRITCPDCGVGFVIVPGKWMCPVCGELGEWECKSEATKKLPT